MSNNDAKIQVNIKSGEGFDATLVNVYATGHSELEGLLAAVVRFAPQIAEARAAVATAHGITLKSAEVQPAEQAYPYSQQPPAPPQQNGWQNQQSAPPPWVQQPQQQATQFSQPAQGPAPQCQHGVKKFLVDSKHGNDPQWKAWACPADRNDPTKCRLDYVN